MLNPIKNIYARKTAERKKLAPKRKLNSTVSNQFSAGLISVLIWGLIGGVTANVVASFMPSDNLNSQEYTDLMYSHL